jgi:predicted permease
MGGLLGILASAFLAGGLLGILPADATGGWLSGELDGRLVAYGFMLSLVCGAAFGLAPAWRTARFRIAAAGPAQSRLRRLLVCVQIGLSLLLLIAAGLFARSLHNLLDHNLGFEPERLIAFSADPSLSGYSRERSLEFSAEIERRMARLPGVESVAGAALVPFGGPYWGNGVKAPGTRAASDKYVDVQENAVSPNYFRTLGIRFQAGRDFTAGDTANSPKVAIVNRTLARFLFENENPIGRHLTLGESDADAEIVGVVADSQFSGVRDPATRFLYVPYPQGISDFVRQAAFFARTRIDESRVMGAVAATAKEMDPNVPIQRLAPMSERIRDSVRTDQLLAILAIAFAVLAATLAAVGLYGIVSYAVTRRTREFGIRIALGAARSSILGLVLWEVCAMLAVGIAVGLPASYALARLVESRLFGIRAHDPWVLAGAAVLMAAVAIAAGLVPGARAMRIEPARALKHE